MNINYTVFGSGVPVIFLHGMGAGSTVWKPIVKEIQHDRQCILFDLPGHGKTPHMELHPLTIEDLTQIIMNEIDKLNIEKFHFVGHSLGGWVGLDIASDYPDRVLSFTAIAPGGLWREKTVRKYPPKLVLKLMSIALPLLATIIPKIDKFKKIALLPYVYDHKRVNNDSLVDAIKSFSIACNSWYKSKNVKKFELQAEYVSNGFTKDIDPKVPITVIFGQEDKSATLLKHQDRSLLPQEVRWISLPDSGHVPMWDNYEKVLKEIKINIYLE